MSLFYDIKNETGAKDSKGVAYKDIPNGEFAYRVWESQKKRANGLKDITPMGIWADEYGLNNEDFNSMIAFSKTAGYDPTNRSINSEYIPENSRGRAIFQGQTFGFGDEIVGGMAAGIDKVTGNKKPLSELYVQYRDKERQMMEEYRQNAPKEALSYEIGGAFLSPAMALTAPKAINTLSSGKKAMAISGTYGTAYGAGSSDKDTAKGVAGDAAFTGLSSSLFGLGLQKAIPFIGAKAQDVAKWMKKAQDNPTIETLKIAKDKAYKLVTNSDIRFFGNDLSFMLSEARKIAVNTHHQPHAEPQVKAALNIFRMLKTSGKPQSLTQLDKIRQKLSKYYKSNPDQPALGDMMDLIDTVIQRKAGQYPIMDAARIANTKFKKAEKIEQAFHTASTSTDLKGAGAPLIYKTAIASLLKNKKDMRWFSNEERVILEQFVKGKRTSNAIARVGGLAPTGNRLVAAIAMYGFTLSPLILVPLSLSMAAKRIGDKTIRTKAENLIKNMGGIKTPAPQMIPGVPQATGVTTGAIQGQ
jgi:hypothetical protein